MNHFDYRNGWLHAAAVDLAALADAVGTPFYCYSTATLERHYRVFADAFADVKSLVCYSLKPTPTNRCCARWQSSAQAQTWFRAANSSAPAPPGFRQTRFCSPG